MSPVHHLMPWGVWIKLNIERRRYTKHMRQLSYFLICSVICPHSAAFFWLQQKPARCSRQRRHPSYLSWWNLSCFLSVTVPHVVGWAGSASVANLDVCKWFTVLWNAAASCTASDLGPPLGAVLAESEGEIKASWRKKGLFFMVLLGRFFHEFFYKRWKTNSPEHLNSSLSWWFPFGSKLLGDDMKTGRGLPLLKPAQGISKYKYKTPFLWALSPGLTGENH